MVKPFLIFSWLFISFYTNSQQVITGTVIDNNGSPVPYTSIYSLADSVGTYAAIDGKFELTVKSIPVSLECRNVGFKTAFFIISKPENNEIQLHEKVIELNEVLVITDKAEVRYIGSPKKTRGIDGYIAEAPNQQLALMIKNKDAILYKNAYLDQFSVKIVPPTLGGLKPTGENHLRLRIYTISTEGKVGEDLLHENVFLSPSKAGWYNIKLTREIHVPQQGFVVAVEWLKNQKLQQWGKNNRSSYSYGVLIYGHKIKEEEQDSYLVWVFNPTLQKWGYYNDKETIPAFRLTLIEEQ